MDLRALQFLAARILFKSLLAALEAQGVKYRRLAVAQGAHSPLIDPMLDEFEAIARTVNYSAPRIDMISCTTGALVSQDEATNAGYWRRHLRQPVQFARVMQTLHDQGYAQFVEIGPDAVLLSMGQRCLPTGYGRWIPSLREGQDDTQQMYESLGKLFTNGVDIDWDGFYHHIQRPKMVLPTYPFDHARYWLPSLGKKARQRKHGVASSILGERLELSSSTRHCF